MAGADYRAKSDTLAFAPDESAKTVRVAVHDDEIDAGEETMTLTLSNPRGAGPARQGVGPRATQRSNNQPTETRFAERL